MQGSGCNIPRPPHRSRTSWDGWADRRLLRATIGTVLMHRGAGSPLELRYSVAFPAIAVKQASPFGAGKPPASGDQATGRAELVSVVTAIMLVQIVVEKLACDRALTWTISCQQLESGLPELAYPQLFSHHAQAAHHRGLRRFNRAPHFLCPKCRPYSPRSS